MISKNDILEFVLSSECKQILHIYRLLYIYICMCMFQNNNIDIFTSSNTNEPGRL